MNDVFRTYLILLLFGYIEAVVYIALSFSFPVAAFFALACSMIAEYAKARVSLVVKYTERHWSVVGVQSHRVLVIFAGVAINHYHKNIFGLPTMEFFLYFVGFLSTFAFFYRFFFSRSLIEEESVKQRVLEVAR